MVKYRRKEKKKHNASQIGVCGTTKTTTTKKKGSFFGVISSTKIKKVKASKITPE